MHSDVQLCMYVCVFASLRNFKSKRMLSIYFQNIMFYYISFNLFLEVLCVNSVRYSLSWIWLSVALQRPILRVSNVAFSKTSNLNENDATYHKTTQAHITWCKRQYSVVGRWSIIRTIAIAYSRLTA